MKERLCLPGALWCLLVFSQVPLFAADPPVPPKPAVPVIHWPTIIPAPAPIPAPSPDAPVALPVGVLFVLDSDTELNFDQSPADVLMVFPASGPVSVPGVFVDGTGKTELRSYTAKFVYLITANTSGPGGSVKLTEIPDVVGGWKLRTTKTISVGPPAPIVPPVPPTPADPLTAAVQAAYTAETDPAKAAQVVKLASVFGNAGTIVDSPKIVSMADVFTTLQTVRQSQVADTALTKVRAVVNADIIAAVGQPTATAMTDADKTKIKAEFAKLAGILGGIK